MARLPSRLQVLGPPSGPDRLLDRIRWAFVALNVFATATTLLALFGEVGPHPVELFGAVGLGIWAIVYYRHRARGVALNLAPYVFVLMIGLDTGADQEFVTTMYVVIFLQSLYPRSRPRRVLLSAGTALVYLPAAVIEGEGVVQWASDLFGFVFVAVIVAMVATAARRHERLQRRDAILTSTMGTLLAERRPDEVDHAVARAALELVEVPEALCSVWRGDGPVLERRALVGARDHAVTAIAVDDLPDDLRGLLDRGLAVMLEPADMRRLQAIYTGLPVQHVGCVVAPVVQDRRTVGLLVVASPSPMDDDLVDVLQRFAHEVSLLQQLIGREALLTGVVDNSPDVIAVVDDQQVVRYVSPSLQRVAGLDASEVVGGPLARMLTTPADPPTAGVELLGPDGGVGHQRLTTRDGSLEVEVATSELITGGRILNIRDVTERRRLREEVEYRAFHDTVTGLPNRQLFMDRLGAALRTAPRRAGSVAVMMVDVDDFKRVNDTLGHAAGDELLVEVASRILSATRAGDTAARLGGDEFAILLVDVDDPLTSTEVAERLLDAFDAPLTIAGQCLELTASIGVATGDRLEATQLLKNADAAMYSVKSSGKGRWAMFDPEMQAQARARQRMARELEAAVAEGGLELAYQPIVSLQDPDRTLGVEALLRWTHPRMGEVAPADFVPLAEETGLIVPLGRWVVREACRQLAAWDLEQGPDLRADELPYMSVNLSPVQLRHRSIVTDVRDAVDEVGIDPARLVLELTETALVGDVARVADVLGALKRIGVRLAIDDFGTGYSSFSHLQQFPIDVLKVDRSFVALVAGGQPHGALAHAIVSLATTLDIDTVAEGVEDAAQADVLTSWGCRSAQGWLWAPALPAQAAGARIGQAGSDRASSPSRPSAV